MPRTPQLGETWRSITTNYEGMVSSIVQYLTGCDQIGLASPEVDDKGEPRKTFYFDVPFCEFVKEADPKIVAARNVILGIGQPQTQQPAAPVTGGPREAIPERQTPR